MKTVLPLSPSARIAVVSGAWSEAEAANKLALSDGAGKFFYSMLKMADIDPKQVFVTSVFNLQPRPTNDIKNLCGPKAEGIKGRPAVDRGKYVLAKYEPELRRLYAELDAYRPTVILALGPVASWALLDTTAIKKIRGAPLDGYNGYKVIPTYHPFSVIKQYNLLPVVLADLDKLRKQSAFPEVVRPARFIHVEPTIQDLHDFEREFINNSVQLSMDVETAQTQITCIGFAPTRDRAIVIPFTDDTKAQHNYWPDLETELEAWAIVRRWCNLHKAHYVGQNFNYDMKFILQSYGITCLHATDDTMLLHHALQPEMEKGLGFLASIYTDELSWKFMRPKHTVKKED
jgi:uracil-DNA glycosylase